MLLGGRPSLFYESCSLCLRKSLPKPQRTRGRWLGKHVQQWFKGRLGFCSPNVSQLGLVLTHCGHVSVLLGWLVIWLRGKLVVPARPLVRKLQRVVSQGERACPPCGMSVLSYEAESGWKTEMMNRPSVRAARSQALGKVIPISPPTALHGGIAPRFSRWRNVGAEACSVSCGQSVGEQAYLVPVGAPRSELPPGGAL